MTTPSSNARRARRAAFKQAIRQKGRSSSFAATVVGICLTLLVCLPLVAKLLDPLQNYLHDWRARFCQFGRPAPTDSLVTIGIDDRALDVVGRWPWSRELQARILKELIAAGPKAIALDILHDTPDEPRLIERDDDGPGPSPPRLERVDGDALLAEAIGSFPNLIIALSVSPAAPQPPSGLVEAAIRLLKEDLNQAPETLLSSLTKLQYRIPAAAGEQQDLFLLARRRAVVDRVMAAMQELGDAASGPAVVEKATGQPAGTSGETSVTARIAQRVYEAEIARRKLTRFGAEVDPAIVKSTAILSHPVDFAPITAITEAAKAAGFVTFPKGSDGRVRTLPIVAEYQSRLFPGLGLALAMRYLDVPIESLVLTPTEVRLTNAAGKPVGSIPIHTAYYGDSRTRAGGSADLAFFGSNRWETMFDPQRQRPTNIVSILNIWEILDLERRLESNRRDAAVAQREIASRVGDDLVAPHYLDLSGKADPTEQAKLQQTLKLSAEFYDFVREVPEADRDEDTRKFLAARAAVVAALAQNQRLLQNIDNRRADLRQRVGEKAVIVGFTATGATDFVPTPLHASAPGVMTHAVVFNSIVTNNHLSRLPELLEIAISLMIGSAVTFVVARMNAVASAAVTIGILGMFLAIDGWVLYGPFGYILGSAGPVAASVGVWAACTLTRYVYEQAEKRAITRRFQSYVDPKLVKYVLAHPEKSRLDGERRNISVVFTDLAGFTTISEKLGERTVGLLNEYFELMVPIVFKHNGYMNKFLGDGMMFFFNAPEENPNHARDAVRTVLEMQQAVTEFNKTLAARDLPAVKMRAGITTGPMIVGDAGSSGANDYTVLGDAVNLAARLESANKASGTLLLASKGVIDHMGEGFVYRPIGKLQVVGKTEGIETFNILCTDEAATETDRKLCAITRKYVEAYAAGKFMKCMDIINDAEEAFGPSKLTALYTHLCEERLREGVGTSFSGFITLSEK